MKGKRRTAPTARTRAVEALRKALGGGRLAAPLVGELSRGLSAADADLLRELTLGVLRWKSGLDAEIAAVSRIPLPRLAPNLLEILEVALYQLRHLDRIPPYAAVSEAVEHARASGGEGAGKLVNGILRGILLLPPPARPGAGGAADLARDFSHPRFLVERWMERFGGDTTRRVLAADNASPSIDLLVNPTRGTRDALRAALAADGVATEASPLAPLGLTVTSGRLVRSPLLSAGRFSVQDVGGQVLTLLLPEGGDLLVDLAAAPGGKSLSALAHGRARRSVALDGSIARLTRVAENARRLGAAMRPVAADLAALPLPPGRFDRVLLDAPCSGTGTLRKNPEIRYRVTPDAIERLAKAQEAQLAAAAALLSPGGFLLYSTCSLEVEENGRVVERVCASTPGLSPAPIAAPPALSPFVEGARFRIFPDERVDGFTAHLLRRDGPAIGTRDP